MGWGCDDFNAVLVVLEGVSHMLLLARLVRGRTVGNAVVWQDHLPGDWLNLHISSGLFLDLVSFLANLPLGFWHCRMIAGGCQFQLRAVKWLQPPQL